MTKAELQETRNYLNFVLTTFNIKHRSVKYLDFVLTPFNVKHRGVVEVF